MGKITLGLICGLAFGIIDILVMLPMKIGDRHKKAEAIVGAFIDRFMLGFLIPNVNIGVHPAITGALLGLGLSLPPAIITRAYAPILGIGVLGGLIIGSVTWWVLI